MQPVTGELERYLQGIPWWAWLLTLGGAGTLIALLGPVLTPFVASFIIAYLFQPIVARLETWGLPRAVGIALIFTLLILIVLVAILLLIPVLQQQLEQFSIVAPQLLDWLQTVALPWLSHTLGVDPASFDIDKLRSLLQENFGRIGSFATTILGSVTTSGLAAAGFLANLLLIPFITFYLLRDWPKILASAQKMLPRPAAPTLIVLTKEADDVLSAFLRGQLSVMLVLGLYYGTGLWLVGLSFAILIGFFAGLVSFVPYLGVVVGLGSALITAAFTGADASVFALILLVFATGQFLEGSVVTPYLVGDRIGLHPVMVIFCVLAGGQLFGFVGILLALPVSAILAVFARYLREIYQHSELYDLGSQVVLSPPGPSERQSQPSPSPEKTEDQAPLR